MSMMRDLSFGTCKTDIVIGITKQNALPIDIFAGKILIEKIF